MGIFNWFKRTFAGESVGEEEFRAIRGDLKEAREWEKQSVRTLRREATKIKEAKKVLAGLVDAIAKNDPRALRGKRWLLGQVAKVKKLEVGIGGYVGLAANAAMRIKGVEDAPDEQATQLETASDNILKLNKEISEGIRELTEAARNGRLEDAAEQARKINDAYSALLKWTNSVVALEHQVTVFLAAKVEELKKKG